MSRSLSLTHARATRTHRHIHTHTNIHARTHALVAEHDAEEAVPIAVALQPQSAHALAGLTPNQLSDFGVSRALGPVTKALRWCRRRMHAWHVRGGITFIEVRMADNRGVDKGLAIHIWTVGLCGDNNNNKKHGLMCA